MKNLLKSMKLLSSLWENDLNNLSLFCQNKIVKKWEVLFYEWDEANAMYLLRVWSFDITKTIKGNSVKLWSVQAEEVLWEMALFWDHWKRMATATATMDSELITILSFSIKELAKKNPDLLSKIKDIINERLIDNKLVEEKLK